MRLPHVLTSLRMGEQGAVDEALAKFGLRRWVALTTTRFVAVPFLVAGAPVITTMPARLARLFATELGLSLSPVPCACRSQSPRSSGTPPTTMTRRISGYETLWRASLQTWDGNASRRDVTLFAGTTAAMLGKHRLVRGAPN